MDIPLRGTIAFRQFLESLEYGDLLYMRIAYVNDRVPSSLIMEDMTYGNYTVRCNAVAKYANQTRRELFAKIGGDPESYEEYLL